MNGNSFYGIIGAFSSETIFLCWFIETAIIAVSARIITRKNTFRKKKIDALQIIPQQAAAGGMAQFTQRF